MLQRIQKLITNLLNRERSYLFLLLPRAYFFCLPEPTFFCLPERSEGSLGTCVPRDYKKGSVLRDDTVEGCRPEPLFVAPRRQPRGLPGDAIPNEVSRDAVPNKVRREAVPNDPFYVAPSVTFFVAPSVSEGSLGANAPRDDRWEALAPNVELYPSDARSILVRQKVL